MRNRFNPNFSESRICPNIYRMFRSVDCVDWTHDMIIVKWHLFIGHERIRCALTNAPPVQSIQTGQWLSTLFRANFFDAQVYVLHPRQFIFALSCIDHSCRYYNPLSAKRDMNIINLKSDLRFYSWRIVMFLELSILIDIWSSFRVLSELSPWVITRWIKKIMLTKPLISKTNLIT